MIVTKFPREGSCLQCGWWYYGNGNHPINSYQIMRENSSFITLSSSPDLTTISIIDNPALNALAECLDSCARKNGGCENCAIRKSCYATWVKACLLSMSKYFNFRDYRLFAIQFQKLGAKIV